MTVCIVVLLSVLLYEEVAEINFCIVIFVWAYIRYYIRYHIFIGSLVLRALLRDDTGLRSACKLRNLG